MRLVGMRNQCQGCKQYFNSNYAFDKHRTGEHGVDRRCLTSEEMLGRGMSLNHANFWITETRDAREFMDSISSEQSDADDSDAIEDGDKPKVQVERVG